VRIFLISPVRNWQELPVEEKSAILDYVTGLEKAGNEVHWPMRDTDQENDPIGCRICRNNRAAMNRAHQVHIWWTSSSEGSKFDLGMWFGLELDRGPKLVLANPEAIAVTPHKSFGNVMLYWTGHLEDTDPHPHRTPNGHHT
jgi:hypothetical protein